MSRLSTYKAPSNKGQLPGEPGKWVNDLLTPCSPGDPGAIAMSFIDITDGSKLHEPPVTMADLLKVRLKQIVD